MSKEAFDRDEKENTHFEMQFLFVRETGVQIYVEHWGDDSAKLTIV